MFSPSPGPTTRSEHPRGPAVTQTSAGDLQAGSGGGAAPGGDGAVAAADTPGDVTSAGVTPATDGPAAEAEGDGVWEDMARVLTASGRYRVLRRFRSRSRYAAADDDDRAGTPGDAWRPPASSATPKTALFVDVETTGLDAAADAVVEFAAVPFTYDPATGRIHDVRPAYVALEDPGRPIPAAVTALTGITDAMVAGHRADDARVAALVAQASLVLAHNAAFDRKFCERRFPAFAAVPWACTHAEVPWAAYGCRGTKLDYLLIERCGEFFHGHRAADDCRAAIHVLATPFPCGTSPFKLLLDAARAPTVRVWAPDTPFALKTALRGRRYRWHPGDRRYAKAWYWDGPAAGAKAECAWLAAHAYGGRRRWTLERLTARERYSDRA